MTTYAAYLRQFKTPRAGDLSLEEQRRAIEGWVQKQKGELVATYRDISDRERIMERAGLRRLCRESHDGMFDHVVVCSLPYLARNPGYAVALQYMLWWNSNVTLVSIAEDLEAARHAASQDIHSMLDGVVDWHRRRRPPTIDYQKSASSGMHHGPPPYGYDKLDDRVLTPNPLEANVVSWVFELYASGTRSEGDIARILNEAGHRARGGGLFYRQLIRTILTSRVYLGEVGFQPTVYRDDGRRDRRGRREWYPNQHEPIVSRELFDRCQAVRADRQHKQPQNRNAEKAEEASRRGA